MFRLFCVDSRCVCILYFSFATTADPTDPRHVRYERSEYLKPFDDKSLRRTSFGVLACVCHGSSGSGERLGKHIDYNSRAFKAMTVGDAVDFVARSNLRGQVALAGRK
jgi:hypothetical protein